MDKISWPGITRATQYAAKPRPRIRSAVLTVNMKRHSRTKIGVLIVFSFL